MSHDALCLKAWTEDLIAGRVLTQWYPSDNESGWLYAVLRLLGDIPELWGFPSSLSDDDSASQHAQSGPLRQGAMPINPSPPAASSSGAAGPPQSSEVHCGPGLQFTYDGASSSGPAAPIPGVPAFVPQPPSNAYPSTTPSGSQPISSGQVPVPGHPRAPPPPVIPGPQGPGDWAAHFRQYRDTNRSRQSLASASVSSRGSRLHLSLPPSHERILRFEEMLQIERERITLMEHERDIARSLGDFFYRGLFTEYSHVFTGSRLCGMYRAAILRIPNAMVPLVAWISEHMHRDLDLLCELDRA